MENGGIFQALCDAYTDLRADSMVSDTHEIASRLQQVHEDLRQQNEELSDLWKLKFEERHRRQMHEGWGNCGGGDGPFTGIGGTIVLIVVAIVTAYLLFSGSASEYLRSL